MTDTLVEHQDPEVLFAGEIEAIRQAGEQAILDAQRRLEVGHSTDIIRFNDSDRYGFPAHAAMIKILEAHGVLDDYYAAVPGQRGGRVLNCAEYDDGTVVTILDSNKVKGSLMVSDTIGEDNKGLRKNGQALLYRKA